MTSSTCSNYSGQGVTESRVTALILTFNEDRHLERAVRSVQPFAKQVIVIDSYSTDHTVEIARAMGAKVLQHEWEHNYARQLNWAIENAEITGEWVMRLDADEYVTPVLAQEIAATLPRTDPNISGIYVNRRVHFFGRPLRWGGVYPMWVLRLWRHGRACCETRWMDEHIRILQGKTSRIDGDIVDENLHDLTWWVAKHNGYARREAVDLLNIKYRFAQYDGLGGGWPLAQAKLKRSLKESVYSHLPLFLRPLMYFFYRYVIRLGFLDGVPGLVWHVLQGFWYRFLVDANILEIESKARREKRSIKDLIERDWQLK